MRDLETTMTQKGQVTIPKEIRSRLGLRPKDRVRFDLQGEVATLRPASSKLLAGYGAVEPKNRPEDWARVREEVEMAIAEEVVSEG